MTRWKVKPFTIFILIVVLIFLITGPKLLLPMVLKRQAPLDSLTPKKPEWAGIINLWDTGYLETGPGSHGRWLNRYISSFEKKYPGVLISIRSMTPERLSVYLQGGSSDEILPDIISLDTYQKFLPNSSFVDLAGYFSLDDINKLRPIARDRVLSEDKLVGIPWMMGSYGLILNTTLIQGNNIDLNDFLIDDKLDLDGLDSLVKAMSFEKQVGKKKTVYYGFCTYTTPFTSPLLSMIYQESGKIVNDPLYNTFMDWYEQGNITPLDLSNQSYANARKLFIEEKRVGVMLGGSHVIYSLRRIQEAGKGFEYKVVPIPVLEKEDLYLDQVAAFGLFKEVDDKKTELCVLFLKGMLEVEHQRRLSDIGMFSVLRDLNDLYEEDEQMSILENSLDHFAKGPYNDRLKNALDLVESMNEAFSN